MLPKVDTFTQNIADEIRRKEASLSQIAAATEKPEVQAPQLPKKNIPFIFIIGPFFLVCFLLLAGVAYFFFPSSKQSLPTATISNTEKINTEKITQELILLSPTLAKEIGRYVTKIDKKDAGYILTINAYSPVFAYMTRNEEAYIQELARLFPEIIPPQGTSTLSKVTSEKKEIPASTSQVSTSTATTSPNKKNPSSNLSPVTQATSSTPLTPVVEKEIISTQELLPFKDITIDNQNMRIWTTSTHIIVYAFIADKKIIISNTPEKILLLKGDILR